MEKLPMCRICLVENVRMYVVVDKNLHELYEKLTNVPFETQDTRPIHVCSFCYAKLKQCWLLLRKCLEAENLFAQMMKEDYEPNPLRNQGQLELFSGFMKPPIANMIIKKELPADYEKTSDLIETQENQQRVELEPDNLNSSYLDVLDIPPYHLETDSKDDVPIMKIKIEVEEEQENLDNSYPDVQPCHSESNSKVAVPVMEFKTEVEEEQVQKNLANSNLDVLDIPPYHSESDSKHDLPTMEFKTEVEEEQENLDNSYLVVLEIPPYHSETDPKDSIPVMNFKPEVQVEQEVSRKKQRATKTIRAPVVKEQELDIQTAELGKQKKDELTASTVIQIKQNSTSRPGTKFKKPFTNTKLKVNKGIDSHDIKRHPRLSNKDKLLKCDTCQHSFNHKGNLINHIRTHTGEKPFKCEICQRSFIQKSSLSKHVNRLHNGEKPHKCDICQRDFRQKCELSNHYRTHTGEKPYKCDICQHCFTNKNSLTKHTRVHTGEKPYKCDVCQRCFNDNGNYRRHYRIHTVEKE